MLEILFKDGYSETAAFVPVFMSVRAKQNNAKIPMQTREDPTTAIAAMPPVVSIGAEGVRERKRLGD